MPADRVDESTEATAYYVFAEAVTNAQKHSRASSISVRATAGPRTLRIEVVDDGVGGATPTAGSGLQGLRDRVQAAGGTFAVRASRDGGTRIVATLPMSAARSRAGRPRAGWRRPDRWERRGP